MGGVSERVRPFTYLRGTMTLKGYAKAVKVDGSKVTLPIAGHSVSIEMAGTKGKGFKVASALLAMALAVIGIY